MRKFIIIALAVLAGAYAVNTSAADKKDKKKKKTAVEVKQPVVLTTVTDSASYAMGVAFTNGLTQYLVQQHGVDTAYIADFIRGFEETRDQFKKKSVTAYGAGVNVANMVEQRMIPNARQSLEGVADSLNSDLFYRGFLDAVSKDSSVLTMSGAEGYTRELKERQVRAQIAKEKEYLEQNSRQPGVVTLPSGLQYKVLREGNGPVATANDEVVVKYEGRLLDGTVFDSSYTRADQTNKFKPTQVIKGWTEALMLMPAGSMWELYIPHDLAYGERQAGKIPPYSTLIFKVELEEVLPAAKPAPAAAPTAVPSTPAPKATPAQQQARKKAPVKRK